MTQLPPPPPIAAPEPPKVGKIRTVVEAPPDQTVFDKEATRIAMETKYTAGVENGRRVRRMMNDEL
jgi:protein TonB